MDSTILSIIEKRKLLNWSAKKLAEKANVPFSAVLRMEKGTGMWPDYIATIKCILVPCNIIYFVFIINMISWHKFKDGGCHVAKISSHVNEGGTYRS